MTGTGDGGRGSGAPRRSEGLSYRAAGVDIDRQDAALARIREHVLSTRTPGVLTGPGSFGGLFALERSWRDPVLVSSVDGVGTKVMVAQAVGRHDTIGEDLVNHCVNDILVMGARPLFFLDYLATGRLDPAVAEALISGIARACRAHGCALLGGETAEMPDLYRPEHYDLAGSIVGVVERERILDGSAVRVGERVYGLASSGLHTNGYTLARRIVFDLMDLAPDDPLPGCGRTVADALLAVHTSYARALAEPLASGLVHALAHITGGGLVDNLPRVLPAGMRVRLDAGAWTVPALFTTLMRAGGVPLDDMRRTFNLGIGMVAIVAAGREEEFERAVARGGAPAQPIGVVEAGEPGVVFEGEHRWEGAS